MRHISKALGVVHDSRKCYPRINNSISQSAQIPPELLEEHGGSEPWNDTAIAGLTAPSSWPDLCYGVNFCSFLNIRINIKGFFVSKSFNYALSEVGLVSLIALSDFRGL